MLDSILIVFTNRQPVSGFGIECFNFLKFGIEVTIVESSLQTLILQISKEFSLKLLQTAQIELPRVPYFRNFVLSILKYKSFLHFLIQKENYGYRKCCRYRCRNDGNGIAHTFAQFGYTVTLIDVSTESLHRGVSVIEQNLGRQVKKGIIDENVKADTLARITPSVNLEEAAESAVFNY